MAKRIVFFGSFRVKVTALFILLMLISGAVSNFLIYEYSLRAQMDQLRDKLMTTAQMIALNVDAGSLLEIPLNNEGIDTPQYRKIEEELVKIRDVIPSIVYIYILEKTEKECVFKFIIDLHPGVGSEERPPAIPGEEYECSLFPEMMKAFNGPSADRKMVKDEWGVFLSGYAPIRDSLGNAVAILGIDMSAGNVYGMQKEVRRRALFVLLLGIILSVFLGFIVSGRVTKPINKLLEGTRRISAGRLDYRVRIKGSGEIRELADSFNRMAGKLSYARKELLGYFYRVAQSMVRILEAKDSYTRGHSDRVADYAEKIALELGLPPEKIELLKESALLHDIGKMGVADMILHKSTELTEEDRNTIRKHPETGEDILKPVSLDKEMLAVVRQHHERYDGSGYPDGLKGDEIDIMAAIVAVADSYDAMTSHRPYMKNFSKKEAMEQIRENSGKQFKPEVVDAFIRMPEEEK